VVTTAGRRGSDPHAAHTTLVQLITDYLRFLGAWQLVTVPQGVAREGVPDLLVCLPTASFETHPERRRYRRHLLIAVAVKTGRFGHLTAPQALEREALLAAGALFVEAHDIVDLLDALAAAGLAVPRVH